ncbi:NAD(P)H-dependent glycerol-3-phosphate dehydrogenase [Ancylobacter pratisalsi]|uniref:Glycerol-3-phosphate dehydrogenase [NAD(P)+] n=1 Tax=Ancylobacter pratisalsi TaxID=1745854 RepID=A0A6P1YM41_9HYPH|nr:NAD(P)H-dependent glycerol-3-phosphate dehydrogenase [Ancylobacter pratisalsi]QIB33303.1 NAD(P)-dependent glycerol-3-phosphate dehydrogenase [Ancylobacter pratisalsi]
MKQQQEVVPAIDRIAVMGGGAWGTALAVTAIRAGRQVTLWAREPEVVEAIRTSQTNPVFLPGIELPPGIMATTDLGDAVREADAVLLVVPSQHVREACQALKPHLSPRLPIVICAKGIEQDTGLLLQSVLADELPDHPVAVLSGPTFAHEVAAGEPTAVTIASDDVPTAGESSLAARMAVALGTQTFRPYVADDVTGVEVGGAVKNVLALASGMASGLSFGANTRAAIITRGLDEIKRLSEALGGRRDTVTGLSGIGDLTLTCSSEQSRNMRYGMGLAMGRSAADIFDGRPVVVEGVENAVSVTDLARRLGVEMPICEAVRAVVIDGMPIQEAVATLLGRPFKAEPRSIDLLLPGPSDTTTLIMEDRS